MLAPTYVGDEEYGRERTVKSMPSPSGWQGLRTIGFKVNLDSKSSALPNNELKVRGSRNFFKFDFTAKLVKTQDGCVFTVDCTHETVQVC